MQIMQLGSASLRTTQHVLYGCLTRWAAQPCPLAPICSRYQPAVAISVAQHAGTHTSAGYYLQLTVPCWWHQKLAIICIILRGARLEPAEDIQKPPLLLLQIVLYYAYNDQALRRDFAKAMNKLSLLGQDQASLLCPPRAGKAGSTCLLACLLKPDSLGPLLWPPVTTMFSTCLPACLLCHRWGGGTELTTQTHGLPACRSSTARMCLRHGATALKTSLCGSPIGRMRPSMSTNRSLRR